jgi:hypothetical protein
MPFKIGRSNEKARCGMSKVRQANMQEESR